MAEHTKGKWALNSYHDCITDGHCILAEQPHGEGYGNDNFEANATLMAASPDLFEGHKMNVIEAKAALKARKLYKHGTDIGPIINGFIECLQRIVKRSEQVIAKAKPAKLKEAENG